MSNTVFVTIVVAILVANLGTVFAVVWYLGGRIEGLGQSLGAKIDQLDERLRRVEEDVAVLKAVR